MALVRVKLGLIPLPSWEYKILEEKRKTLKNKRAVTCRSVPVPGNETFDKIRHNTNTHLVSVSICMCSWLTHPDLRVKGQSEDVRAAS